MTPFRFIHCSDLHIDSPFKGLSEITPQWAERLRRATAKAWDNIVTLALKEQVDAVLIAGDIFDGADRSLQAQFKFRRGLKRLSDAGIRAFIACGNHDPLASWAQSLEFPETVTVFPAGGVERRPVIKDGAAVAQIYGISFAETHITENLALQFQREAKDGFAVAMLHANVGGDPNHDNYAPCALDDLIAGGFDYWALGHIHLRAVLRPAHPAVVYCGNAQARHFKETGAKGCCLVTLNDKAEPDIRFIATDAARFVADAVDLSGAVTPDDALRCIEPVLQHHISEADGRLLAARFALTGRTPLHSMWRQPDALRDLAGEVLARLDARDVWLELDDATRAVFDLDQLRGGQDFIADLIALYDATGAGGEAALQEALDEVFRDWKGHGHLDTPGLEELRGLLERARDLTLDRLLAED